MTPADIFVTAILWGIAILISGFIWAQHYEDHPEKLPGDIWFVKRRNVPGIVHLIQLIIGFGLLPVWFMIYVAILCMKMTPSVVKWLVTTPDQSKEVQNG